MSRALLLSAVLPLAITLAGEPGQLALQSGNAHVRMIEKQDIPLEDLAHSFFFHTADPDLLKDIISAEGVNRLEPELVAHRRDMTDLRKIAPKLRRMCSDLQEAENGQEFAAVLIAAEAADDDERQQAARRILSKLNDHDRAALERYLDTDFRQGSGRGRIDYEAMFAFGPFPSSKSILLTQRTCDSALQMEVRVKP